MFCARHIFCSQVFKYCKYCFDFFLFAGGDKVGSLADVKFKAAKNEIPEPWKAKTNDNWVTNYRPARDPQESKFCKIRYKILQCVAQHCFVASFGSTFRVFHLAWSICRATTMFVEPLLQVEGRCCESRARVYFEQQIFVFVASFSSNLQLVATCHATNFLMLRDKLRVFVSHIFRRIFLSCESLAGSLLQLSFGLALLSLNSV